MNDQANMEVVKQVGQLASAPGNDPSKLPPPDPQNDGTQEAPTPVAEQGEPG